MRSDEALYKDVCKGSEKAFGELYARYEGPLFGFILRRAGNSQDAEEIFHDVMLAVLKNQDARFVDGGFAAWIYKIALNAVLNRSRRQQRASAGNRELAYNTSLNELKEEPLQSQLNQEQQSHLAKAASTLSPALRQVYELRQAGKSYEETAQTLELPLGSVKSRINAMVKHLRKELTKWNAK